uniref:Uncharacterized protein n=1 Tax=Trieres chinensis TaxID=1514140 RepID=A0A7S2ABA8_TRICV|mmetsp:Transcript_9507/g.20113  ORF Transcript_9507/g.20113 Transcript_9507/m.20113 type:complete len:262 (+) Transcript_9507:138-923(+)|eukprot:CAMPEP_0183308996 /NCGR_PEP_ID=MMETSP0160_2-20130417/23403_1 /TAXON_ID=2839 ORGANISM="Odontella Sinensis, Strain Grunow 1884" /NCGR_SAMPLE_ID=MMETSP0160_2 /ASSEMBLY_ACC=CAM_ASM_000250 /LENGTH=261 /DNA_ID=CAMNT_0025472929 /DNA_START=121 /DNA_END=906 /DNA_ORIENTATION=+
MTIMLGDLVYVGILLGSCTKLALIVAYASGRWDASLFGEHWRQDGFCVSFPGTYVDSHYLSFYVDMILVGIMKVLVSKSKHMHQDHPGITVLEGHIPSLGMHGVGHLLLTAYFGGTAGMSTFSEKGNIPFTMLLFFGFFINFIRKPFPWSTPVVLVQALTHALIMTSLLPTMFSFTYVSLVYNWNLVPFKMFWTPKDKFYTTEAVVHRLPVAIMSFLEPLLCDSLLVHLGGHVFFDANIGVSAIIFYFVVRNEPYKALKTA